MTKGQPTQSAEKPAIEVTPLTVGDASSGAQPFDQEQQDEAVPSLQIPVTASVGSHDIIHNVNLDNARRWIYLCHFFARFCDSTWQFAINLFLTAFTNYQSMFLVSSYGIVSQLSIIVFGSISGRFVDETNRLRTAQLFFGTQTAAILMATLCSFMVLIRVQAQFANHEESMSPSQQTDSVDDSFVWWDDHFTFLLVLLIHVFGPLAEIFNVAFLVVLERDWIVTMMTSTNDRNSLSETNREEDGLDDKDSTTPSGDRAWLTETNVRMKQLNLLCQAMAPTVAGWAIGAFDSSMNNNDGNSTTSVDGNDSMSGNDKTHNLIAATLLLTVISLVTVLVEFVCTARVYCMIPTLQQMSQPLESSSTAATTRNHVTFQKLEQEPDYLTARSTVESEVAGDAFADSFQISENKATASAYGTVQECDPVELESMENESEQQQNTSAGSSASVSSSSGWTFLFRGEQLLPSGWKVYFQQPIAYAGLGLALTYVNALTFASLMTSYVVSRGMDLGTVGLLRGISGGMGLVGTVAYRVSVSWASLVSTGFWSIAFEFVCLTTSFTSFFVPSYTGSMALLILGVCASRIGLWVFDTTVTQMMQELVPEGIRGVVGGTQQSLNAFFQCTSFALGLIFYKPDNFFIYAAAGYLALGIALLLYYVTVYRRANQLFPTLLQPVVTPSL